MRSLFNLTIVVCLVSLLGGCTIETETMPEIELRYVNNTNHSLHLKMSWYIPSANWPEREFYSVDIPAGSQSFVDYALEDFNGSTFSSCSIEFDDGKALKYHISVPYDYDGSRPISTDPLSPLSPGAYSLSVVSGVQVRTFTFTDEHYQLAE